MPESKSKIRNQKSKIVKVKIAKSVVKKAVVKAKVTKAVVSSKGRSASGGKKEVKKLSKETSLKLSVYDTKGKAVESISLPKEIFGVKVNTNLMTQAVRVYLANQRRGTVKTKSRGEVNISTSKIYRQKGTGRARHGAASAPIFVGGGLAFGPRQRDYSLKLSQKMRKTALFSALSSKLKAGEIKIVAGLEKLEPKTKIFANVMKNLSLNDKKPQILLVTPPFAPSVASHSAEASRDKKALDGKKATEGKQNSDIKNITKGARNLRGVTITSSNLLNTYDILSFRNILFMKNAIEGVKETFLKDK